MLNVRKFLYVMICISLLFGVTACSQPTAVSEGIYTPGTYSSTKKGFGGNVKVTLEVDNEKIVSVAIDGASETNGIGTVAIDKLSEEIINKNSADVDIVAGATASSNAIIKAVEECLAQAKGESITEVAEAKEEEKLDIGRAKDVAEQYCRMLLGKFSSMKSIEYTGENYINGDTITFVYDVKYDSNINKKGLMRVLKDTTGSYKVTRMDEEMY